jgi:hypothetical protein
MDLHLVPEEFQDLKIVFFAASETGKLEADSLCTIVGALRVAYN